MYYILTADCDALRQKMATQEIVEELWQQEQQWNKEERLKQEELVKQEELAKGKYLIDVLLKVYITFCLSALCGLFDVYLMFIVMGMFYLCV